MKHFDLLEGRHHVAKYSDKVPPKKLIETALWKAWKTTPSKNNAMPYKVFVFGPEHKMEKEKDVVTLILGGPTKYYNYSNKNIIQIFSKINKQIYEKNLQLVVIPSNRTPEKIIQFAKKYFNRNSLIVDTVDKQAYLSSLALAKYIIVTCDSSSMISEAALTGKPVYVAMMPSTKSDKRFEKFRNLLESMNIIRKLENELDTWSYEKLDETNRIAKQIKEKLF